MSITLLKSLKKDISIKNMVHRSVAGFEKARSHAVVHASDLLKTEFCPREWWLLDQTKVEKRDEFIGTALRITFSHGRDMEFRFRNEWLRDSIVGMWKCGVCGNDYGKLSKAPTVNCSKCGWGHQWEYDEVRFTSKISGISGGVDGLVDVGETKLRLLELKSMDKDMFKELKAPLAEHKFRTALYLKLASESEYAGRINTNVAHVLYVSKSFGFKDESLSEAGIKDAAFSPFKEYTVDRDDNLVAPQVARSTVLHKIRVNPKLGAPCGICKSGLEKRAQQCATIKDCFSGKFQSTITWLEDGAVRHPGKKLLNDVE